MADVKKSFWYFCELIAVGFLIGFGAFFGVKTAIAFESVRLVLTKELF